MAAKQPTDAQKAAGNYQKEHRNLHGMRISLENPAGSIRTGKDAAGQPWSFKMKHDYGYVRGSKGKDKDHVDVFLGPEADNPSHQVYVIDQDGPDGSFDEHKAMIGFADANDAYEAYHENYPEGHAGFGAITSLPIAGFRAWAGVGREGGKRKRISELAGVERYRQGGAVARSAVDRAAAGGAGAGTHAGGCGCAACAEGPLKLAGGGAVAKAIKALRLWHGGRDIPTGELLHSEAGVLYGSPDRAMANDYAVQHNFGNSQKRPEPGVSRLHQLILENPNLASDDVVRQLAKKQHGVDEKHEFWPFPQMMLDSNQNDLAFSSALRAALEREGYNGAIGMDQSPFGSGDQTSVAMFPSAKWRPVTKADGGAVTPNYAGGDGGMVGYDTAGGAYVGSRGRRRAENNDPEAAKEMPLQAARGALTATLGFGGDMEGLLRTVHNKLPSLNPLQALLKGAVGDVGETPFLPTGDFYSDILPLAPTSAAGRAAASVGSLTGVPLSSVALGGVRAAQKMAPAARGALTAMTENAMAPRQLSSQAGAVKLPGGNWYDPAVENVSSGMRGWEGYRTEPEPGAPMSVADWMQKRMNKYIRNELGTAKDPLLKLEAQGISHLTPEELLAASEESELGRRITHGLDPGVVGYDLPKNSIPDRATSRFHAQQTGRDYRTPWENLSDNVIIREDASSMRDLRGAPEYLKKLKDTDPVYDLSTYGFGKLGFRHMRDYLDAATEAGNAVKNAGGIEGARRHLEANPNNNAAGLASLRMAERNLHIDPADLSKMSLPDVVRKTHDWNRMMAEMQRIQDRNKGIKSVLKEYPDTGLQWAELSPEGLGAEGNAMGHCVGGYCSQVEGGNTRIVSLRDKEGQPHVTVELVKKENGNHAERIPEAAMAEIRSRAFDPNNGIFDTMERQSANRKALEREVEAWHASNPGHRPPDKWDIRQIKGKQNAAPVAAYQPAVQDFVRSMGPWGDIRDLENTGLFSTGPNSDLHDLIMRSSPGVGRNERQLAIGRARMEGKLQPYMTREEWEGAVKPYIEQLQQPKSEGFASGGSVGAGNTVGLGTFSPSPQQQVVQQNPYIGTNPMQAQQAAPINTNPNWNPASGAYTPASPTDLMGLARPAAMNWGQNYGLELNGALPQANPNSPAPIYDLTTPAGLNNPMLQATLKSANAGNMATGIKAFLGNDWSPEQYGRTLVEDPGGGQRYESTVTGYNSDPLLNLAKGVGFNAEPYASKGDWSGLNTALDKHLQDYAGIKGLSSGWDMSGKGDRSAAQTLYKNIDGKLTPVTMPRSYVAPRTGGYLRQDPLLAQALMWGASILTGGLAAGAGAGATAAAGSGTGSAATGAGATSGGWGSTLANAAGAGSQWAQIPAWGQQAIQGAAQGALTSSLGGGNPLTGAVTGAVGGLGGAAGSAAGSYLNPALTSAGGQLGALGARYFTNQAAQRT